jgi:hydrogenase expression/formation protein HypD
MSLLDAKAKGADVRVVYSVDDAVKMAEKEANRDFVFFAIGFETTAPSTAAEAARRPTENLTFLISHRVIPPAMELLVNMKELNLDGFIAPGHVSTIIGLKPYEIFPKTYKMPTVVTGFEPLDVLVGIYMIVKQIKEGQARLENQYTRAVSWEGNLKAQEVMHRVFNIADGNWRGLGEIPLSKLEFKPEFEACEALLKHDIKVAQGMDTQPSCQCHLIIVGKIKPTQCPLFMRTCTPQNPVGACMVGSEGTCRIWARTAKTVQ